MLIIRLQRVGKKHQPQFRVVLAEKTKSATKKFQEILGNFNPRTKEFLIKNEERLKYWLDQNVEVSPTVNNLLATKGMVANKVKAWRPKPKEESKEQPQKASSAASAKEETAAPETPVREEVVEEKTADEKTEAEKKPAEEAKDKTDEA